MPLGLKVWLSIWSFITAFIMFQSLDRDTYIIFSYEQMINNIFIFVPLCCVLFGSILFQVLQHVFKHTFITACVAIATYFIALKVLLPYSLCACLLLGVLAIPAGIFHYVLSVIFFGSIES